MSIPALSVIMPIFNGAKTLRATLESLIDQGEASIEILAVDQGSDDGSRKILKEFSGQLPIQIIDAPKSTNWMANTNIGLAAASAPLITMLHQDDIWLPGRLDALLGLATKYPDAELWLHPAWFMDTENRLVGTFGPAFGMHERLIDGNAAMRALIVQNSIALPAAMFRRASALKLGGLSEDLWYTADWDFWLKLVGAGSVAWMPRKLAAFRVHEHSQTVKGSRDMQDFAAQLAIPLERHLGTLPNADIPRSKALAEASNCLNTYLAARYHKQPTSIRPFLDKFFKLGPSGWAAFLRDTRIIKRIWPRLRILRSKRKSV
ncbi:MAG: glycosyltransferase [Marinosulfonomonas sp.]|nr:glycosyltransferase [Marinosulfonomonas sp.]